MTRKQPWFERQFPTGLPADLFPVVVERLRGTPARLEDRLSSAGASTLMAHTAPHPRLRVPMNLVDHAFFVAEHDDYHLARITELLIEFARMA